MLCREAIDQRAVTYDCTIERTLVTEAVVYKFIDYNSYKQQKYAAQGVLAIQTQEFVITHTLCFLQVS